MAKHLHKKFTDSQVKELIERYLKKEIERKYIQEILGIKKRRLFELVKLYRENPVKFSIKYIRKTKNRISQAAEKNIIKELKVDKGLIENKDVPLGRYNYSYVKTQLEKEYKQKVSLPTIIDRAKKNGFYLKKKPKKKLHDREVITNYTGELIQHDSSLHLFSPLAKTKWYLITSIDDYSRFLLYAMFLLKESTWAHILALQTVFLKHGLPYSYYTDSHRIFRFVQGRDSIWRKHYLLTDDVDTQWGQVMDDCGVKVIPALSPQAKGKVERPYGWLQDHLVRTCVRENVTDMIQAQRVLQREVHRYNYKQVHSTTEEVPYYRFQRALKEKSLFRKFAIKQPYTSVKDIFCLRMERTIDAYRKISLPKLQIKLNNATPREKVKLRIYPMNNGISEVRFWCNDKLIDIHRIKNSDLDIVHF
jgi:hypothetical protein